MTRTPLSRSKGQSSKSQEAGHIVAASDTACYRIIERFGISFRHSPISIPVMTLLSMGKPGLDSSHVPVELLCPHYTLLQTYVTIYLTMMTVVSSSTNNSLLLLLLLLRIPFYCPVIIVNAEAGLVVNESLQTHRL